MNVMSTNNTGKTGTHRARTREIVRFRVTVTLKVLFLCLGSPRVLWRSSVLHVPRIKHSRRPKRKQNGRRTLLLSSNMYRAYFTKKRYSSCKRDVDESRRSRSCYRSMDFLELDKGSRYRDMRW